MMIGPRHPAGRIRSFVSKFGLSLAFESATMQRTFGAPGTEGTGIIPRTVLAGLVGGTASKLGGGKFASGAASAAVSWVFNSEGTGLDSKKEAFVVSDVEFEDTPSFSYEFVDRDSSDGAGWTQPKLRFRYTKLDDGTYRASVSIEILVTIDQTQFESGSDAFKDAVIQAEKDHYLDAKALYENNFRQHISGLTGVDHELSSNFSGKAGQYFRKQWAMTGIFWDDSGYHVANQFGFANGRPSEKTIRLYRDKHFRKFNIRKR